MNNINGIKIISFHGNTNGYYGVVPPPVGVGEFAIRNRHQEYPANQVAPCVGPQQLDTGATSFGPIVIAPGSAAEPRPPFLVDRQRLGEVNAWRIKYGHM